MVVADFETTRRNQENYFEELRKTASRLEGYKDVVLKIDSALPSNPLLPELFNFIQKLCSQSGLVLSKIGTISTNALPQGQLKETKAEITVSGNYSAFKNFLSGLEKSSRLIEVESVSFSATEKEPFVFNLKIKIYSY